MTWAIMHNVMSYLLFQAPYNTVVYELVTRNNQFALNNQSGEISVKTDLTSETSTSFTVSWKEMICES